MTATWATSPAGGPACSGVARSCDAGFATVWAAGAVAVLVTLTVATMQLAAVTGARHRAEAAADLGALAAAAHAVEGEASACAYAARITEEMVARLVRCRLEGWEVVVEVDASTSMPMSGPMSTARDGLAHGRARAGPADG